MLLTLCSACTRTFIKGEIGAAPPGLMSIFSKMSQGSAALHPGLHWVAPAGAFDFIGTTKVMP